jgi:hypothetical protein
MIPLVLNPHSNYHRPTAILCFKRRSQRLVFAQKIESYEKILSENAEFFHGSTMPEFFVKKTTSLLTDKIHETLFCASSVVNKYGFKRKKCIQNLRIFKVKVTL